MEVAAALASAAAVCPCPAEAGAAGEAAAVARILAGGANLLSRSALPTTKTLESAIAPAASIGESSIPVKG